MTTANKTDSTLPLSSGPNDSGEAFTESSSAELSRHRSRRLLGRLLMTAAQIGTVLAAVMLWQLLAQQGMIDRTVVGEPSLIAHELRIWWDSGELVTDLQATLVVLITGYLIGLVAGALLGAALGLNAFFRDVAEPFIIFFNGMPRLLLYPLLIVVIGFGTTSKLLMVILAVVVLVAVTIATGFREIPDELTQNMRLMGASGLDLGRQVYLPSLTLWILSTTRTTIGYAFSAAIVAEFVGATSGIGYRVVMGQASLNVNSIWAAIVVVVLVALLIFTIVGSIERRATKWLPE
ncbi:ABC transporter permease [Rhodococcus sp. NPDC057529]|uniref:ABC transporter permease n=1 Tax=Rhodococcus sp. NPDC057529 TaxID=3346158 RepID=UPI003670865E